MPACGLCVRVVPSYLVARPSRDLIVAAHQQITQEWWNTAKDRFDLYVSEAVLAEIRAGDANYAARRSELVAELDVLAFSDDVEDLIRAYHHRLGLVGSAAADLPHLAYAVAYNMDYLVTWNCKHIANGQVIRRLNVVNTEIGRPTPVIVTPEELLEALPGDDE
jgi:predicted nucleic acid-binding protein